MDRPRVGVGVIVVKKDKILLGKRKGSHGAGCWGFAGGYVEFGEEIEICAARELKEETGLTALSIREGPWVNNLIDGKHCVTLFLVVDRFEGKVELLEPHKCEGWAWFDWSHLPTPLFPPILSLIEKSSFESFFHRLCKE